MQLNNALVTLAVEPYHEPLIPIPDVFDGDYDPLRDDVYYDDYLHVISSPIKARLEDHLLPEELFDQSGSSHYSY